jgi:hypothetical protein
VLKEERIRPLLVVDVTEQLTAQTFVFVCVLL